MSRSDEFRSTVRSSIRVGRATVVVHAERATEGTAVRVGFVVSKAVGNAVVRNRVKRRLRHLVRAELASAPGGIRLVVRALPQAATTPHALPADLERAWVHAVGRVLRMRSR